jgi:hypothetical protein
LECKQKVREKKLALFFGNDYLYAVMLALTKTIAPTDR